MKVALCLYKYFPYGGLQRDFLRIANELVARGHQVRVYVESWQGEKPQNMEIIQVPVKALSNHRKAQKFHAWVMEHLHKNPVDRLVGFNKMPNLDVYYGADICYEEKARTEKGFFYRLTPRYHHLYNFEAQTVGRGLKTKLMIITPKQKVEFQKHYQTEDDRFYLLPPGIAKDRKYTNFSDAKRQALRDQLNLTAEDFLIIQIGSDFKRKGLDRSIAALASLPKDIRSHAKLYVLGQDKPQAYEQQAQQAGVGEQVHILGGRDDVADFIAAADLFVHPARSENTGTVILEAMVGGVPQIVTEVCGYAHYVKEADSGLVLDSPYDQEQFNQFLLQALNKSLLSKWRDNACRFADTEDLYSLPQKAADIILE